MFLSFTNPMKCMPNDAPMRQKAGVIIVPQYEHKEEVKKQYYALHKAIIELASSYTEDELKLITQFLEKANIVIENQSD